MPLRVPEFLLRRIYVRGSLRRTADGFEFELQNTLGSGYAQRLLPLSVDGCELDINDCLFEVDGEAHGFADVSPEHPFSLAMNRTSVLRARGHELSDAPVAIRIGFEVPGLGELSFEVTDTPAER